MASRPGRLGYDSQSINSSDKSTSIYRDLDLFFGKRTVGLFNPDKGDVRSIFAKFDPKQSESGNIYASVAGGGAFLGLGALEGIE